MISVDLARRLQAAGLRWQPAERDFFVIPDHNLEGQVFVVSQLTALLGLYNGSPVVTFHGSTEWALDYVLLTEVIWLPTEEQLRERLASALEPAAPLRLERNSTGYSCHLEIAGELRSFGAADGATAYGLALLRVLQGEATA